MKKRRYLPIRIEQWGGDAGKREQEWLDDAWHKINTIFASGKPDEIEKTKLGLRAIALSLIYLDFCYLA